MVGLRCSVFGMRLLAGNIGADASIQANAAGGTLSSFFL